MTDQDLTAVALADAAAAAERARVTIREVDRPEGCRAVSRLFNRVWGRPDALGPMINHELLIAAAHAGHQVTIAEAPGGDVLGATYAFLGSDHDAGQTGTSALHLHSHITGVSSDTRSLGVGYALKLHQRAWCLARGITEVRWTFDPLVRRNAWFNLVKLGAEISGFQRNRYGVVDDAISAGLGTDRFTASWRVDSDTVADRIAGARPEVDVDGLVRTGAAEVLLGADALPHAAAPGHDTSMALVQIPADIEALRRDDRPRAQVWAEAVRSTLGREIRAGARVAGFHHDGWYLLDRAPATPGGD